MSVRRDGLAVVDVQCLFVLGGVRFRSEGQISCPRTCCASGPVYNRLRCSRRSIQYLDCFCRPHEPTKPTQYLSHLHFREPLATSKDRVSPSMSRKYREHPACFSPVRFIVVQDGNLNLGEPELENDGGPRLLRRVSWSQRDHTNGVAGDCDNHHTSDCNIAAICVTMGNEKRTSEIRAYAWQATVSLFCASSHRAAASSQIVQQARRDRQSQSMSLDNLKAVPPPCIATLRRVAVEQTARWSAPRSPSLAEYVRRAFPIVHRNATTYR